jgi:hypothetical protein
MGNTPDAIYVKWRKRAVYAMPNAVSGPCAESKFLSLINYKTPRKASLRKLKNICLGVNYMSWETLLKK